MKELCFQEKTLDETLLGIFDLFMYDSCIGKSPAEIMMEGIRSGAGEGFLVRLGSKAKLCSGLFCG